MSSLSYKKLSKLRSGHTVWRVFARADEFGELHVELQKYVILGKRTRYHFNKGYGGTGSILMQCARPEIEYGEEGYERRENRAQFLTDLHGTRCFSSERAANRFVKDLREGRYPDIHTQKINEYWDDRAFEESMAEYLDDFDRNFDEFSESKDDGPDCTDPNDQYLGVH